MRVINKTDYTVGTGFTDEQGRTWVPVMQILPAPNATWIETIITYADSRETAMEIMQGLISARPNDGVLASHLLHLSMREFQGADFRMFSLEYKGPDVELARMNNWIE